MVDFTPIQHGAQTGTAIVDVCVVLIIEHPQLCLVLFVALYVHRAYSENSSPLSHVIRYHSQNSMHLRTALFWVNVQ